MNWLPKFTRRTRWAVPGGVLAVVAAVAAGALVSTAQASPALPARTPAQLLAAVAGAKSMPALTGTVVETANLGLPSLPGESDTTSPASLLSGSHTVRVWYADASHMRLAVPGLETESDFILDGNTAWLWQSSTNSVDHFLLSKQQPRHAVPVMPALTPQQAANQAMKAVGPTTKVSVESNVVVAGQPAYQLVLAPKSPQSLVGQVRIAVDASHNVPLRVQVFAKHASSPAFQVGFTSISFVRPAAANFRFTPPPHAKVSTDKLTASGWGTPYSQGQPKVTGQGWLAVAELPAAALSGLSGSGSSSSLGGVAGSAAQSASSATPSGGASKAGEFNAVLGALLGSAKQVQGSWGSGRLLHTSLVSMLTTSDGKVFIGAVTPSVLYAAAAHAR